MSDSWSKLLALCESIPSESARAYLLSLGFLEVPSTQSSEFVLEDTHDSVVSIPKNRLVHNYGRRMLQLAESIASNDRPLEEIVTLMAIGDAHVYRHRIEDADTVSGTMALLRVPEVVTAISDFIRFSAAGVVSAKRFYTDVPPDAKSLSRQCRFGQTELGSLVIKVFCPRRPAGVNSGSIGLEELGTRAIEACVENLEFVNDGDLDNPPATFNRNVASAISRMRPPSDFGHCSIDITFSAAATETEDVPTSLEISPLAYSRAEKVQRDFSKMVDNEIEVFAGHITDLHKDRPTLRQSVNRAISIDARYGASRRKVQINLPEGMYRRAVQWHDLEEEVLVQARVDKRRNPWQVVDLVEFRKVDTGEQLGLFPSDDDGDRD